MFVLCARTVVGSEGCSFILREAIEVGLVESRLPSTC
jgi:hypothetical protein